MRREGTDYRIVGAVGFFGRPRSSIDVDLVLDLGDTRRAGRLLRLLRDERTYSWITEAPADERDLLAQNIVKVRDLKTGPSWTWSSIRQHSVERGGPRV